MKLLPYPLLLLAACSWAQQPGDRFAAVDRIMEQRVAEGHLAGGVVAIGRDGKTVHLKAYGQRDRERGLPMETNTIFRIYSMTKGITSAAALMLVEEGKLDLDAPVARYIPEFNTLELKSGEAPKQPPLVRDLFTHTSGFGYDGKVVDREKPAAEMIRKLAAQPLPFEPGTDWRYGSSIDVLGHLVEKRSGQSLDRFLRERFFEPLGMVDTGFHVPPEKRDRFAAMYNRRDGKLVPKKDDAWFDPPALCSGGGGLVGTAGDYLTFLQMIAHGGEWRGKRYLEPETVALMTTRQSPEEAGPVTFGDRERTGVHYGLGFNVRTAMSDWDPDGKVGEYGWGGAASTHYWCHPDHKLVVVTMEQVKPFSFGTEWALKKAVYNANR